MVLKKVNTSLSFILLFVLMFIDIAIAQPGNNPSTGMIPNFSDQSSMGVPKSDIQVRLKQLQDELGRVTEAIGKLRSSHSDLSRWLNKTFMIDERQSIKEEIARLNDNIQTYEKKRDGLKQDIMRIRADKSQEELERETHSPQTRKIQTNAPTGQQVKEKKRCDALKVEIKEDIEEMTHLKKIEKKGNYTCKKGRTPKDCKDDILQKVEREALKEGGTAIIQSTTTIKDSTLESQFIMEVLKAKIENKIPLPIFDGQNHGKGTLFFDTEDSFGYRYAYSIEIRGIIDKEKFRERILANRKCYELDSFRVVGIFPLNDSKEVSLSPDIEITFSQPPTSSIRRIRRSVYFKHRRTRIKVKTTVDRNSIILKPVDELLPGKKYSLKITKRLADRRKQILVEQFESTFTTKEAVGYFVDSKIAIEFAPVKGGCFKMGNGSMNAWRDESPEFKVCVDDYYISRYEVSNDQWEHIMNGRKNVPSEKGRHPKTGVAWPEIEAFLKKIKNLQSESTEATFDVPSEVEWEFACKGGLKTNHQYGTRDNKYIQVTNYGLTDGGPDKSDNYLRTAPIDSYGGNALGVYNMSGNIFEWTRDKYCPHIYQEMLKQNKRTGYNPEDEYNLFTELVQFKCSREGKRTIRGGSWFTGPGFLRCKARVSHSEQGKTDDVGIRLIMYKFNDSDDAGK